MQQEINGQLTNNLIFGELLVTLLNSQLLAAEVVGSYFNDKLPSQACALSSSCSTKSCGMQTDPIDSSMLLDI